MKLTWTKTSAGGYMTQRFGGWFTGESDAYITPGEGCEWHVSVNVRGQYTTATVATAAAAKRFAAKKMKDAGVTC
jgi:hypothetical protein